jgi:hypothetical protein
MFDRFAKSDEVKWRVSNQREKEGVLRRFIPRLGVMLDRFQRKNGTVSKTIWNVDAAGVCKFLMGSRRKDESPWDLDAKVDELVQITGLKPEYRSEG